MKIKFEDGIPNREERRNHNEIFIYPEELLDKKCGGCRRCEKRDGHGTKKDGYHCCMRNYNIDITPDDKACVDYWDKEEHDRIERLREEDQEKRREELWSIFATKEPVKLPIQNDGYGRIPICPVCGEMPYSTEQCHWCGQRFIQDDEVEEYAEPQTIECKCTNCGKPGLIHVSKYNGHKSFHCLHCGVSWMS